MKTQSSSNEASVVPSSSERTPFEEIGGSEVIEKILDDLYTRLFEDPMVAFLFEGQNKEHIVQVQAVFTRRLLGDTTAEYKGLSIPDAHAKHPILPGHFDRRHHLLKQTLDSRGVPERVKQIWLRLDSAMRPAILKAGQNRISELRWQDVVDDKSSPL